MMKKCLAALAVWSALILTGCSQERTSIGVIGGQDGPTTVVVVAEPFWWVPLLVIAAVAVLAIVWIWRRKKRK